MLCSDTRPSRERDGGIAMGGCRCRCMFRVPHYPVAQLQVPTATSRSTLASHKGG